MKSAFWPFDDRLRIINSIIKPGFAKLREELGLPARPGDALLAPLTIRFPSGVKEKQLCR